ncbi:MAG: hypothetical protein KA314_14330 [Chloroflexi bacterium]|nr:hypothetical protein [Chloroflexota bacterium]MBP8057010.1 hypothetical protein [Chloroflexota bacterium]
MICWRFVGSRPRSPHTFSPFHLTITGPALGVRPRSPNLHPFHHTITGPASGVAAAFPRTLFPFHYPSPGQFLALRPRSPHTISLSPHHHRVSFEGRGRVPPTPSLG